MWQEGCGGREGQNVEILDKIKLDKKIIWSKQMFNEMQNRMRTVGKVDLSVSIIW